MNRSFFEKDPVTVAKELLGCFFVRKTAEGEMVGMITETEAYGDASDLASHARFGQTKRNSIMYGPAGILYVYHIYGIFYLTNIICQKEESPGAVLIRSAEILKGNEIALQNIKKFKFVKANEKLAVGPGKFSLAFDIDKEQNHTDLFDNADISLLPKKKRFDIISTKRVGIDYARECKELPWRFHIQDNPFVSKK